MWSRMCVYIHCGGQTAHSAGGVYKETNSLKFYSPIILAKVMPVCYIILQLLIQGNIFSSTEPYITTGECHGHVSLRLLCCWPWLSLLKYFPQIEIHFLTIIDMSTL